MKKRFSFLLSLFIFLLILVGCDFDSNGNSEDNSKIPTYIGMQILNEDNRNTNRINTSNNLAINGKEKKEEDDEYYYWLFVHVYGYWGWSGRRPGEGNNEEHLPEDYNQENDYNYDIENEVKIDVLTDDEVKYFVRQNEDFILQVKLSNPENYEIQSFTLNGKKYSNYMFEYGSDMENLYLKVKAPEVSGYTEYTIDAIKYIDGENIKDVDLSTGEKTIKAGVQYDIEPEATISNVSHTTTSFDANVKIEDRYNLLENNPVKFFVYDGTNIVYEKELVVGDNVLHASNLLMNYKYEYAVVGVYDPLDGQWNKPRCLLKGEINTDNAYELKDVVANKEGVSFDFTCNDNNAQISYIAVYDKDSNNTLVKSIEDLTTRTIDGLLSNHNYILYAEYTYTINEKEYINYIYKDFDTLAKKAASLTLKEVTATQTTLTFDYDIVDTDNILTIESISLYNTKNELVKSLDDLTSKEFTDLLSNTTYEVRLVYKYNLNDGSGEKELLVKKSAKTIAKKTPTLKFTNTNTTQTTLTFDYDIVDTDNILIIESISLYNAKNELVKSLDDLTSKEFTELLSNTTYEIRLVYKYDLNDGNGEQSQLVRKEEKTVAKSVPTLTIKDVESTKTTITFDYDIVDTDNILTIESISLYNTKNELVKSLDDLALKEFTELLSNTTYEIRLVYKYDLNDGNGEKELLVKNEVKTIAKEMFTLDLIRSTEPLNGTQTLDYVLSNNTYTLKSFGSSRDELVVIGGYYNGLPITKTEQQALINCSWIKEAIILDTVELVGTELFYGTSLERVIFQGVIPPRFDYNILGYKSLDVYVPDEAFEIYKSIRDSLWIQNIVEKNKLHKFSELGLSYDEFFYGKYDSIITNDSLEVKMTLRDIDNVGKLTKVELYLGNKLINGIPVNSIIDGSIKFDSLLSGKIYTLTLSYTYNLNDGLGEQVKVIRKEIKTVAKTEPTLEFKNVSSTKTTITFDYDIIDTDNILTIESISLYNANNELVKSLDDLTSKEFTGLLSDTTHEIRLVYKYDLNDGAGEQSKLVRYEIKTVAKTAPIVNINVVSKTATSIEFDYDITDDDCLFRLDNMALYNHSGIVATLTENEEYKFTNLTINDEYKIVIYYKYDLNDGNGNRTDNSYKYVSLYQFDFNSGSIRGINELFNGYTSLAIPEVVYQNGNPCDVTNIFKCVNSKLLSVSIPNNVVSISNGAFNGNEYLSKVIFGNESKLSIIYDNAFGGCPISGELIIPASVTILKSSVFNNTAITKVTFEEGSLLTEMSFGVFYNCEKLEEVILPAKLESIGEYAFSRTNIKQIIIPEKTVLIGKKIFELTKTIIACEADSIQNDWDENWTDGNKFYLKGQWHLDEEGNIQIHKNMPTVTVKSYEATSNSISLSYEYSDVDNSGSITKIELFKGKTLIASLTSNDIIKFDSLDSYTNYTVIFTVSYDLNDGKGEQITTESLDVKTKPFLEFKSCKVVNTSAVSEGETIYLQAILDNPSNGVYSKAIINGIECTTANSSTPSMMFVELINNGEYGAGLTKLEVEKLFLTVDGETYEFSIDKNNVGTIFINGKIEVENVAIVDADYKPITKDWFAADMEVYAAIDFNNPTGYTIDEIGVRWEKGFLKNLTKISDSRYIMTIPEMNSKYGTFMRLELSSFKYSNEYLNKEETGLKLYSDEYFMVESVNNPLHISTVDDLKNIVSNGCGKYCVLDNDIDLDGLEWTAIPGFFKGVIDGKNHSIKNMSYASKATSTKYNFGLITGAIGVVENLKFESILLLIDGSEVSEINFGAIACYADVSNGGMVVRNCSIDSTSTIFLRNCGGGYVGGFVGRGKVSLYDCENEASITSTTNVGEF